MFPFSSNPYKSLVRNLKQGPAYVEEAMDLIGARINKIVPGNIRRRRITTLEQIKGKLDAVDKNTYSFLYGYFHLQAANNERVESKQQYHFEQALSGFETFAAQKDASGELKFIAYWQAGKIRLQFGEAWPVIEEIYLLAFEADPIRAESLKEIIAHYYSEKAIRACYIYSSYVSKNFFDAAPVLRRRWMVDVPFYTWQVLNYHIPVAIAIQKYDEATESYDKLVAQTVKYPDFFSEDDLHKISKYARHLPGDPENALLKK